VSEPGWLVPLLGALLLASAFCSASEAALFSLTASERKGLSRAVRALHADPRSLLACILLANLVVNSLYFAFARGLRPGAQGWAEVLLGLGALVVLVLCGEILPKILGLRARRGVARASAPLLGLALFVLAPLARPLLWILERVHRRLAAWIRPEGGITPDVLARVLERGAAEGALEEGEADLLAGILELEGMGVRAIMRPRVDALFLDVSGVDREAVRGAALARRLTWLPVHAGDPDRIVGRVDVRQLVRSPERPVRQLVMPVLFVPEVASALDVLRTLRESNASEAVVVDEHGGTAGVVSLEDAFEGVLGDLRPEGGERGPSLAPLGGDRYRVPGHLSIREWNEAFRTDVVPREFQTVGGFVTALLGRIPRAGDRVRASELEIEVHEVRRGRVLAVDIGLRPAPGGPGGEP
jgi:CBS domain containing-hemolysin-like protein